MRNLKNLLVLIITLTFAIGHASVATSTTTNTTGRKLILKLSRRLQKNRFDFVSWHRLGVAYYENGYPAKAIKPLLYATGKIREASLNSLYLGLAYEATRNTAHARHWLSQSANYMDESGSKALFELASMEYRSKNTEKSIALLRSYTQKFPAGAYRAKADKLLASALAGNFKENAPGIDKPDMELLYFKNSRRSLLDYPHFWYFQTGFTYLTSEFKDPDSISPGQVRLLNRIANEYGLMANGGIGIGPWRDGNKSASGGYLYRQTFYTTDSRFQDFFDNPIDLQNFPFRFDLLKRRHTLFGDFRNNFSNNFDVGVFGKMEISKIGSEIFSGQEDGELKSTLSLSDTSILIPWISTSFIPGSRTTGYMYMRKEINHETPDLSNKTYDLFGLSGSAVFSFGLSHAAKMFDDRLNWSAEVFNYDFVFNDYWSDFGRFGAFSEVDFQINQHFNMTGLIGIYQDDYALPRPRMNGSCKTGAATTDSGGATGNEEEPLMCSRADDGLVIQGGLGWTPRSDWQVSTSLLYVSNDNQTMQEYVFNQIKFQVALTWAFPNARRVERLNEKFADYVFFKETR